MTELNFVKQARTNRDIDDKSPGKPNAPIPREYGFSESCFANLFFFSPMQLGAREGGFALAAGGLAIPGAFGVYTALITRIRELVWIVIGVMLMKIGNGKNI